MKGLHHKSGLPTSRRGGSEGRICGDARGRLRGQGELELAQYQAGICFRHHIALRGVDVEIETMLRGVQVAAIPKRDKSKVPGALTDSLNLFGISQALTWLAGERRELQEQLGWESQVYPMLAPLVRANSMGRSSGKNGARNHIVTLDRFSAAWHPAAAPVRPPCIS